MATSKQPSALVSSEDVTGTEVYNRQGDHIGEIDHIMLDKVTGRVAYAVMSFGGFLGMGSDYQPVPWSALEYDTSKGGFVSDISVDTVKSAPPARDEWYADRPWEERTHKHYDVPPYWMI